VPEPAGNTFQSRRQNKNMKKETKIINNELNITDDNDSDKMPRTGSIFQNIVYACLRQKQLSQGANSRIIADSVKHKNTTIAVEEVRQDLITFHLIPEKVR
jgi:DNA-directed RNA polymerase subunit K/omega